jgi:HlyD family secretion protein
MKKILKISILVIVIGLILGTMFYLYQKSKKKPEVYEIKSPFVSNVIKKTVATGSVVPRKEIDIKPQVSGIVEEIFIEAGQHVKKVTVARVKIIPNMVELNNAESRFSKINFEDSACLRRRRRFMNRVLLLRLNSSNSTYMNAMEERKPQNQPAAIKEEFQKIGQPPTRLSDPLLRHGARRSS